MILNKKIKDVCALYSMKIIIKTTKKTEIH